MDSGLYPGRLAQRISHAAGGPKTLVVGLGKIGDLVLLTPVLRALRTLQPQPEIHVLAGLRNHQVLAGHPGIERVHVYPGRPLDALPLMYRLHRERFDFWLDPKDHHSYTSRLLVRMARPTVSVGFNGDPQGRCGSRGCFTHGLPGHLDNQQVHASKRALNVAAALGIPVDDPRPWLGVAPEAERELAGFRCRHRLDRFALVNLSAQRPERRWRTDDWIRLIRGAEFCDLPVLVTALPADSGEAEQVVASRERTFFYQTRSVADLLPAVRDANFVVTVDTGVVHIASAFDTPIVALYANASVQFDKYRPLSRLCQPVIGSGASNTVADIPLHHVAGAVGSLRAALSCATRPSGRLVPVA